MSEIWKTFHRDARYEVSDHGRIRYRATGRVRKLTPKRTGHLIFTTWQPEVRRHTTYSVHRAVAETFLGPCPEGMEVCHGPGGPADNRVTNLRWDTRLENMRDRKRW